VDSLSTLRGQRRFTVMILSSSGWTVWTVWTVSHPLYRWTDILIHGFVSENPYSDVELSTLSILSTHRETPFQKDSEQGDSGGGQLVDSFTTVHPTTNVHEHPRTAHALQLSVDGHDWLQISSLHQPRFEGWEGDLFNRRLAEDHETVSSTQLITHDTTATARDQTIQLSDAINICRNLCVVTRSGGLCNETACSNAAKRSVVHRYDPLMP
jgi:hypothetical protein